MNISENKKNYRIVLAITDPFCLSFLRGQGKFLTDRDFEVFIMCPQSQELNEYVVEEGCYAVPIPFRREISVLSDIQCLYKVVTELKRIKPDIINAGTPKAGLLCMIAGSILGIKNKIFTLRGLRSTAMSRGIKKIVVQYMERMSHKLANKVISISPSMAKYAFENRILSEKKTVILGRASSNGVNIVRFNPSNKNTEKTKRYREQFGIQDEDVVIGYVGRIVKSKGFEELVLAFRTLSQKYKLKLLVVGPQEFHSDSVSESILKQAEADSNIILTGKLSDVEFVYPIMDIFCLVSHNFREGFGNVAIEASASGVPIIVTRGAGCQDAVLNGETGTLISPMNPEELIVAIENYIINPEIRKEHGKKGVEFMRQYFRNEVIWNAQYDLYSQMLAN